MVVQTSHVKQQELVAIDKQLRQMSQDIAAAVPREAPPNIPYLSSVPPPSKSSYAPPSQPLFPPPVHSQYSSTSVDYPVQQAYPYSQSEPPETPNPLTFFSPPQLNTAGAFTSEPVGVPSVNPSATNIADLFNSLLKAGFVSTSTTPLTAVPSTTPNIMEDAKSVDLERESAKEYERNIMNISIALTTSDLTKYVVVSLYEFDRSLFQCSGTVPV